MIDEVPWVGHIRAGVRLPAPPLRDCEENLDAALRLKCWFVIEFRLAAVVWKDDAAPVPKPGFQVAHDEAESAQSVSVNLDVAEAPEVMFIPAVMLAKQLTHVAVRGLEVMWPEEHALVPVDRAVAHGNS